MRWTAFAVVVCASMLAGCQTMTVEECKVANWSDVGLRDGMAGEPLATLDDRVKDCAEAKVRVDVGRYHEGRSRGLMSYCQPDNAVRQGLAGKTYHGVCAAGIEADFRYRFDTAKAVYNARQALQNESGRRYNLESRLRDAKTEEERRRARDALERHDQNMRHLRDRLYWAESALARLR